MADFDAGSIEGTLELDASPFKAGLDKARADADAFGKRKIKPSVTLDDHDFDAKKDDVDAKLDKLGHKKVKPKVELTGVPKVLAELKLIKVEADKATGKMNFGGIGSMAMTAARISAITFGVLGLLAAMGPLVAVTIGFGAAALTAFGGAAVGLGLFAMAVKSVITPVLAADKAGKTLTGSLGRVQAGLKGMTSAWDRLMKTAQPAVVRVLGTAFDGIAKVLPRFAPLLGVVSRGMNGVVRSALAITKTPLFGRWLSELNDFTKGFLHGLGPVISRTLATFMHLFSALRPLMRQLGDGILYASKAVEKWSAGLDAGKMKGFTGTIEKFLPMLGHLTADVFKSIGQISKGLAPLSGPAIMFIDSLVKALGHINFRPLATALGGMFGALSKDLPGVVRILNGSLVPGLTAVAKGLTKLLQAKGAAVAIVALGAAFAAMKIAGIVVQFVEFAKAIKLAALATKVFAAAQVVLDAVMDADPLVLIVAALAALVLGLAYAWKNSTKFREIVTGAFKEVGKISVEVFDKIKNAVVVAFDFIKDHWRLILAILGGPIVAAAILIESHLSQIGNFFKKMWETVKSACINGVNDVVSFFRSLPGKILSVNGAMLSAGIHLMQSVFSGIKSVGGSILGWVGGLVGAILRAFAGIGGKVVGEVKSSISGALGSIGGKLGSLVRGATGLGLASGGVTQGPMSAIIGDNAGGREAVIPLDKYDLPKKGESGASTKHLSDMVRLLSVIADNIAKGADAKSIGDAIGSALDKNQQKMARTMVQIGRAQ